MDKLHINSCSFRDLLTLPYIGKRIAETIMSMREEYGDITEEDFRSIPYLKNVDELVQMIDFSEYVPFTPTQRRHDSVYGGHDKTPSRPTTYAPSRSSTDTRSWYTGDAGRSSYQRHLSPGRASRSRLDTRFSRGYQQNASSRFDDDDDMYREFSSWEPFHSSPKPTSRAPYQFGPPRSTDTEKRQPKPQDKQFLNIAKSISYNGSSKWKPFFAKFFFFFF